MRLRSLEHFLKILNRYKYISFYDVSEDEFYFINYDKVDLSLIAGTRGPCISINFNGYHYYIVLDKADKVDTYIFEHYFCLVLSNYLIFVSDELHKDAIDLKEDIKRMFNDIQYKNITNSITGVSISENIIAGQLV